MFPSNQRTDHVGQALCLDDASDRVGPSQYQLLVAVVVAVAAAANGVPDVPSRIWQSNGGSVVRHVHARNLFHRHTYKLKEKKEGQMYARSYAKAMNLRLCH